MKSYVNHIYVYPIIEQDGKRVKSDEAHYVETVANNKTVAERIKYWTDKAVAWNKIEAQAHEADASYEPQYVTDKFGSLTTISAGFDSFGKSWTFPKR